MIFDKTIILSNNSDFGQIYSFVNVATQKNLSFVPYGNTFVDVRYTINVCSSVFYLGLYVITEKKLSSALRE